MEKRFKEKLSTETTTDIYGVVKNDVYFTNADVILNDRTVIYKEIRRFLDTSENENSLQTIIQNGSSVNTLCEYAYLTPKILHNGKDWIVDVLLGSHATGYFFEGRIAKYAQCFRVSITAELFARARIKVIEMCNPSLEYNFDGFIALLRDSKVPEIEEWAKVYEENFINESQSKKI